MINNISHDISEETIESKAKWFQSLSLTKRMDILCFYTDLAISINPKLQELKIAKQITGRIQVLSKA